METTIKRPLTIWITQIVLLLIVLSMLFNIAFYPVHAGLLGYSMPLVALSVLMFFVAAVMSLIAFFGLVKRRKYGRDLALLLFAAICALDIYSVASLILAQERPWASLRLAIIPGILLIPGILFLFLLILILVLGFGRKTREFVTSI